MVETLGHRVWHCARHADLRAKYGLADVQEESYPRCLTRCGAWRRLATKVFRCTHATLIMRIQKLVVFVTDRSNNTEKARWQRQLCHRHA